LTPGRTPSRRTAPIPLPDATSINQSIKKKKKNWENKGEEEPGKKNEEN